MTQPEPTPGAPAVDPTPPADPTPASPEDITALPEWGQKLIRDARAEAAKSRTSAKQTAADEARQQTLAQVAKALGIGKEGQPVDPDELTAQIQDAQAAAWRSGVELTVHRVATRLGADVEALLDSNQFLDTLDDLVDDDPRSPDFAAALEAKVQAALEKHPNKYKAAGQAPAAPTAPRPDPSQGPRSGSPTPVGRTLTDAIRAHYTK